MRRKGEFYSTNSGRISTCVTLMQRNGAEREGNKIYGFWNKWKETCFFVWITKSWKSKGRIVVVFCLVKLYKGNKRISLISFFLFSLPPTWRNKDLAFKEKRKMFTIHPFSLPIIQFKQMKGEWSSFLFFLSPSLLFPYCLFD